jgi:hypothetical protein
VRNESTKHYFIFCSSSEERGREEGEWYGRYSRSVHCLFHSDKRGKRERFIFSPLSRDCGERRLLEGEERERREKRKKQQQHSLTISPLESVKERERRTRTRERREKR